MDKTEELKNELVVAESKYNALVDNLGVGVSLISPEMKVLAVNALMRQWFPDIDVSKGPLCYKVLNIPPGDGPCSFCPLIKTLKDGAIHETISDMNTGDKTANYRIIAAPVKDKSGNVTAALRIVENITARIKVERELLKKLHDLEVFQKSAVDRELKMIELKKRIKELEERASKAEDRG